MNLALAIPLTSLILPLLTSAAAWAIAVWALRQTDPLTSLVRALTGPDEKDAHTGASAHPASPERTKSS